MISRRIGVTTVRGIIAAVLALTLHSQAQDELASKVLDSATEAIRSELGAVFVVTITHTERQRRSRVFGHTFTVEEVVKPYRNDDGMYWIPLEANEVTSEGIPRLNVGNRYLLVTRLKFLAYGWLYVEESVELGPVYQDHLRPLRTLVEEDAVYGSSGLLHNSMEGSFDVGGIRTPHSDGRVDPAAFGLTREMIRGSAKSADLIVARGLDARTTEDNLGEFKVSIAENLFEGGLERGQEVWLNTGKTPEQWHNRATKMTPPYKLPRFGRGHFGVFLVERALDGPPLVRAFVPEIDVNGPTVEMIRGWLKDGDRGRRVVREHSRPLSPEPRRDRAVRISGYGGKVVGNLIVNSGSWGVEVGQTAFMGSRETAEVRLSGNFISGSGGADLRFDALSRDCKVRGTSFETFIDLGQNNSIWLH